MMLICSRLLAGVSAAVLFIGCGGSKEASVEDYIRPIKVVAIGEEVPSADQRRFPGIVQAAESAVLSFQVSGKVLTVNKKEGDSVGFGEVLATIDPEPFELLVQSADADLMKREVDYRNRVKDYERKLALSKKGAVTAADLDLAQANRDAAQSSVTMARSALDIARRDLRNTVLRAPYDGSVSSRSIEPYVDVASGREVFRVDAKGALEVELRVPENVINRLSLGSTGSVTFSTLRGVEIEGIVSEIGSRAVEANAFIVTLRLASRPVGLHPGMTAEAKMSLPGLTDEGGHLLPATAIVPGTTPDRDFVFVYDPQTKSVRKTFVTIAGGQENMALVVDGIAEGDIVAVAGASFLSDGMKVRLLDEAG